MTEKAKVLRQCGNKISRTELLAALAEECIELSHAALKYRRSLTQDNPTPVDEDEAWNVVKEEISDVMNILVSGYFVHPECSIESICSEDKALRWMKRLEDRSRYYDGEKVKLSDISKFSSVETDADYPCCSNCENKMYMNDPNDVNLYFQCKLQQGEFLSSHVCKDYKVQLDSSFDYER